MAQVTIVIKDKPDGEVSVAVDTDGSIVDPTPAQKLGLRVADIAFHELTGIGRVTSVKAEDADGEAVLDWKPDPPKEPS